MTGNNIDLLIAFTTLLLSVICIFGGAALRLFYHRQISLEYLGWGTMLAAVWNISNSELWQELTNAAAEDYIACYATLLLPVPFFLYLNLLQKKRFQRLYQGMTLAVLLECVVFSALHFLGIRPFEKSIFLILLLFSLFLIVMTGTMLADLVKGRLRDYVPAAVGLCAIGLISLTKLVPFFLLQRRLRENALLPFGLIFLLLAVVNTVHEWILMERQKQQALAASVAKGRFLANMSHEIRTPINAVLGMDAMILRETTQPQIKEYALDIQNAGQNLLALINDILDLSKIESGKLEILAEEYDFSSLLHDIMNMISMKAENKGLAVHLLVGEELPSRLWGDDVRLRQVLVNLMNNAVKYTETGSVTLSIEGCPNSEPERIALTFHVRDTGIGIKEEDLSKLFAEFERIEEQRNRGIEGTGLGMSITTQLLELMGSSLQVESVYGQGSDFYFTLEQGIVHAEPIGDLEARIRRQAKDYAYHALLTAPDAQLLVVDDNAMNRRVFRNLLKATKVQVDEAGGGLECLSMAKAKRYDLIFLDHMMPDLDGIETLHRLQADRDSLCCTVPVIALTANAVSGAREMYLSEGFHSFLSKPIQPEKLERLLLEYLPEEKLVACEGDSGENGSGTDPHGIEADGTEWKAEDLPPIDGIDWDYAQLHMKDTEFLLETIRDFYRTMEGDCAQLLQFLGMVADSADEFLGKMQTQNYLQNDLQSELQNDWQNDLHNDLQNDSLNDRQKFVQNNRQNQTEDFSVTEAETCSSEHAEALRQFRVKVHSMKSSAAMIGATALSGVAKLLEYAARDERTDVLLSVTPYFLEEWQQMKLRLAVLAEEPQEAGLERPKADLQLIREYFPMLEQAMQNLDLDTADGIMEHFETFHFPECLVPILEELRLSVTNLDAGGTAQAIERLERAIEEL
ncbi:MAG: response regulator [Lachnospiraceae bacterium]|nr:response regulator [Lachnospiraceae bacterium]